MTAEDLETIVPDQPATITVDGVECRVKRLKSLELIMLTRVLTNALGPGLANVRLDANDPDEMQSQMIGLFMIAIPEASEQFLQFVQAIVEPVDAGELDRVRKEMQNPDPDVLIGVLETVAVQEKDDLYELWGKVQAAVKRIQSVWQPPKKKTPATKTSARGRGRST